RASRRRPLGGGRRRGSGRRDGPAGGDAGAVRGGRPARRRVRGRAAERRAPAARAPARRRDALPPPPDRRRGGGPPAPRRARAAAELELPEAPVAERAELLAPRADLLMATGDRGAPAAFAEAAAAAGPEGMALRIRQAWAQLVAGDPNAARATLAPLAPGS